jgi:hypothetical protein
VLGQLNLSNDILINRRFAGEQVKGEFSQYFWDYNLPLVCSKTGQMQLFFGSGSTAVFLLHAFRDALHWTRSYGLPRIKLFTNNSVLLTQLLVDELKDMNCDTYIMPGVVDHQYGATRIGEMAPPWFEFMRRPSGESRGLFVFGASLPRNDDPISPGAIDSFRVMRLANESLGYAGVLFLNESNREEDLTADRLTAFLEEGLGSPLPRIAFALSIASRSAKQRDRLWGTLERCRLRPIEPTYHDAEYRHSFPLTALSSNFPTAFGHLIG